MKKIISMLLAFAMIVCLASCADNKPEDLTEKAEATSDVEKNETTDTEEKENRVITLKTFTEEKEFGADDEKTGLPLADVSYQTIFLSDEDAKTYPNLSKIFNKLNNEKKTTAEKDFSELKDWAEDHLEESGPEYFYGYTSSNEYVVQRADNIVFSACGEWTSYTGGVHPNYGTVCHNYDTVSGKELLLSDVITDVSQIPEIVSGIIIARNPMEPFGDLKGTLSEYKEDEFTWTINYQSITFYFSPYEIASYAAGLQTATIFFNENPELFNEKYTESPDCYSYEVPSWNDVELDLDEEDTHTDVIYISPYDYAEDYCTSVKVSVNGYEYKINDYKISGWKNYLVNKAGEFTLYIEMKLSDGSTTTLGLYISENEIRKTDVFENTAFADTGVIY